MMSIEAKAKGGGGEALMNHSEKVEWQEITVLGSYSLQLIVGLFPRMLAVQCPSDSFTNEILNPHVTELTGFILAELPSPCASQLGASRSGPTAQVWPPGTHPWCEGVFPEKGDRCDSGGLYCLRPLQSQAGEHCVTTGPEHTRGGRDLREDVRFAQTRPGTPSPVTFIRHTSMLIWRQECYRDAGSGWR